MFEYEFEKVSCDDMTGYSLFGGAGLNTLGHQEIIHRRAAEGWRYVGCIPVRQRMEGFIEAIELVFERERKDT